MYKRQQVYGRPRKGYATLMMQFYRALAMAQAHLPTREPVEF
ncbi:hypothetical protein CKA32_007160 [Geitlerinema sp. FC II]|nr:hypothetical protein CKA32_007160 [Geitlerinema sp. FC II]